MTSPAAPEQDLTGAGEPLPPQQGMSPAEQAALLALAGYAAGAATAAAALAALLRIGIPRRAARAVLQLSLMVGRTVPDPPTAPGANAGRVVARREPIYRAAYLINAGKRLAEALVPPPPVPAPATRPAAPAAPSGPPTATPTAAPGPGGPAAPGSAEEKAPDTARQRLQDALEAERRWLDAHRRAAEQRRAAARAVDTAAAAHGRWLTWVAIRDSRITLDCAAAHGKAFDAFNPPAIGLPGAVHPTCRCAPGGRARPGTPLVDGRGQVPVPVGPADPVRVPRLARGGARP